MYLIQSNEIKKTTPLETIGIRQLDTDAIGAIKLVKASNLEGIYTFSVSFEPNKVKGKVISMTKTGDQWQYQTNLPAEFHVPQCKRDGKGWDSANVLAGSEDPNVMLDQYIDQLFAIAHQHQTSDLHFEPNTQGYLIRYRIDGLLQKIDHIKQDLGQRLIAKFKVLAQVNIAEALETPRWTNEDNTPGS